MNDVNDPANPAVADPDSSAVPAPVAEATAADAVPTRADAGATADVSVADVAVTAGAPARDDPAATAAARAATPTTAAPEDGSVASVDVPASGAPAASVPAADDAAAGAEAGELPTELVEVKSIIEAALLVAGEPVPESQLMRLFEPALDAKAVRAVLQSLGRDWTDRSVVLVKVASGWRFQGRPSIQPYLDRLSPEKPPRYSRAVMETLAIIAYQQPVTRGDIEAIRGVAVSTNVIKTLEDRQWVEAVGHRETPGRPALFATTKTFLDDLGLGSIAELPPLAELDASHLLEIPDATQQAAQAGLAIASSILAPAPDQSDGPAEPRPSEDSGGPGAGPPPVVH